TREIIQSAYRPYVNVSKVELDRIRLPGPEVIVTVRNKGTVPARRISSTIELRAAGGNQTVSSGKEVFLGPDSEFHISIGLNAATLPINSAPGFQIVINVSYDGAGKDHYTASGTYDYKGTSHGFSMSEGRMD
ncbi:MAG: hypothetical protein ABSA96_21395, partial [Candidatus Acidiferrales bacterium]